MKKLSSIVLILIITAGSAFAESALDILKKEILKTDSHVLSLESTDKIYEPIFLPDPINAEDPSKIQNSALLYLPINKKIEYVYEYESTDFLGTKRLIISLDGYSEKDSVANADVTIIKQNKVSKFYYKLELKADGIHASDNFLTGKRLEVPNSIYRGKTWTEHGDKNRITATDTSVTVPAGRFDHCVKIKTAINNGDAGKAARYYAKGLGLVYEEIEAEDRNDVLRLVFYSVK